MNNVAQFQIFLTLKFQFNVHSTFKNSEKIMSLCNIYCHLFLMEKNGRH